MQTPNDLRAVAVFEAMKGMIVLVAGFGLLSLIHHNVQAVAEELVGHLHLNPAKHLPRIFIQAASSLTDARLWALAGLAGTYASMRLIEAYGLWRNQKWAEWFAIVSGGIYLPFEVHGLLEGFAWLKMVTFTVNGGIVAKIAHALWRRKRNEQPD
ncbi:MAG: DUF2127 domain-containing protein [Limisphaerales bacterium]